ncbi:MAG: PEP/pyruvate-binding domain-containing protein [Planctomycetota bacterium]|jgi:pyruvate,water dikinase
MGHAEVVPLDAAWPVDKDSIGPKAMSLVRMIRAGLAVPAGFCVTERVLREHLERNNLIARLKSLVEKIAKARPHARGALLSNLRQVIAEAPLTEQVRRQIEDHYHRLGAERVAVRSSGTAEDLAGHSFAGQHDSYLGIARVEDCVEAVKKCWASLWTLRAYEYRQRNGFDHLKISMAVIVQQLVAADTSGVIFTADPVTGERGNLLIEACFGLGEALVSGKVTPDRFVVRKNKLKLWSRTISDKKLQCILSANGSVEECPVGQDRAVSPTLDRRQMRRLARLAVRIETEFGCPQDIEWAIRGRNIYLLQSRPITALPPERSWEDRQIWCAYPVREVMPDPVTPVTVSLLEEMLSGFFDPLFRLLCVERGDHPAFDIIAGMVYFNANIWAAVIGCLPGGGNVDGMKLAGSHKGLREVTRRLQVATEKDLPDLKHKKVRFYLKLPLIIAGWLRNTPARGRRILAKVAAETERWSHLDAATPSCEQIIERLDQLMAQFTELLSHVLYLFSMISAFPVLEWVCAKWLCDDDSCATQLLAGVGDMVDADAGLELWRLAVAADESDEVKTLLLSDSDWATLEGRLSQLESGREFLAGWYRFMHRHGHHCRGEIELYNRRWFETPDYILKLVRGYMSQIGKIDPIANHTERAKQRRQLEQKCRRQLRNPLKRLIFNRYLVHSQQGWVFRENVKSEVVKQLTTMRKLLLALGNRLADKDVIATPDDVFFLRLDEIPLVVRDNADFDIREAVASRRAEYDKNSLIKPPDVVIGRFDPDKCTAAELYEDAEVLQGLAVSPGVVTGKARVILRADTEEQLLAGEILVAPFTDPGWTPYFVPAAAIVMNEGGIISHGSIIAREYGIPAVVNVQPRCCHDT